MSSNANPELEDFRRQWQEEVSRKRDAPTKQSARVPPPSRPTKTLSKDESLAFHLGSASNKHTYEDDGNYGTYDFDDLEAREESRKLGLSGTGVHPESIPNRHPISALDHYEMAVVRETEGKLGESLDLYRKAFRLDDCVDQIYKRKHFPPSSFKPKPAETIGPATVRSKTTSKLNSAVSALVASFADANIEGSPPIISGDIPPPCPIKQLPSELLIEILGYVANRDIATLSSLSKVSKRFAYIITTEESLWKRLVHGPRFGLGGMHFTYSREISGSSLEPSLASLSLGPTIKTPDPLPVTLPLNDTYPTYRQMYRHRPRIRFSGVYISTVNYTRPGANGFNTLSWSAPIHVVTYYRYLRFYRDGTCISLLTTAEPLDVVLYLAKENIGTELVATTTLPIGVMKDARRGRWKLAPPAEIFKYQEKSTISANDGVSEPVESEAPSLAESVEHEPEGMLTIETEGAAKNYQYLARFELKSAGGSSFKAQNTKLVWRGFWSHNVLSGDWGEFGLKNDRAFVWSRVRSWGDA